MKSFIRLPEVLRRVSLGRSQVYALISKGEFPSQIKLSERAAAWLESDIDAWIQSRVEASRRESAGVQ